VLELLAESAETFDHTDIDDGAAAGVRSGDGLVDAGRFFAARGG
jgi:hypothetical protein